MDNKFKNVFQTSCISSKTRTNVQTSKKQRTNRVFFDLTVVV